VFYERKKIVYLNMKVSTIFRTRHRIIGVGNDEVKFSAKDYRNGGKKHVIALKQTEFIRRFAMHILPKGFTRIRHYGILSGGCKKRYKEIVDDQIGKLEILIIGSIGTCLAICPTCKKGKLQTVAVFDQRGPPLHWLKKLQLH
jgi:hypothetical protein